MKPYRSFRLLLCSAAIGMLFAGCIGTSTTPTSAASTVQNFVPLVESMVAIAPPLILQKNPSYAPLVIAVATGIPAAFGTGELTPQAVASSIALLGKKSGIDAETQSIIATSISGVVAWYQVTYGAKTLSATDPNVSALLTAVSTGLQNGVAAWKATQPAAS